MVLKECGWWCCQERVAAALENAHLLSVVNKCLQVPPTTHYLCAIHGALLPSTAHDHRHSQYLSNRHRLSGVLILFACLAGDRCRHTEQRGRVRTHGSFSKEGRKGGTVRLADGRTAAAGCCSSSGGGRG